VGKRRDKWKFTKKKGKKGTERNGVRAREIWLGGKKPNTYRKGNYVICWAENREGYVQYHELKGRKGATKITCLKGTGSGWGKT